MNSQAHFGFVNQRTDFVAGSFSIRWLMLVAGMVLFSAGVSVRAELGAADPAPGVETERSTDMVALTAQLLRQRAAANVGGVKASPATPDAVSTEDQPQVLDPLIIRGKKDPKIPSLGEVTRLDNFFYRTGTIYEKVGRKVTMRFWMHPDKGIMLSFYR